MPVEPTTLICILIVLVWQALRAESAFKYVPIVEAQLA
jgi:hypothetical protein